MMIKRILLLSCCSALLLSGCASNPYQVSNATAHFNGKTTISSNLQNLCKQTNERYALKVTQRLSGGFIGKTWYSCAPNKVFEGDGSYLLYFSIIKNDGTGRNIVSQCQIQHQSNSLELHQARVNFTQDGDTLACTVVVS